MPVFQHCLRSDSKAVDDEARLASTALNEMDKVWVFEALEEGTIYLVNIINL